ncbi:hypothetical protein BC941DRAFT_443996 [Chlamydoabsidia padenii]|nr:hypothetical protein BC941DRAFT_443996 [Chlamydoabsidia padenii]
MPSLGLVRPWVGHWNSLNCNIFSLPLQVSPPYTLHICTIFLPLTLVITLLPSN